MKLPQRILVTRTDRLGDVLMSLHAIVCLRQHLPETAIDFLIRPELVKLLRPFMETWKIDLIPWEGVFPQASYDAAICLVDEPWILAQLKSKRVPIRVGNYSKLRSYLALTHGIRQRRGLGKFSEGHYCLELAERFLQSVGIASKYKFTPLSLPLSESHRKEGEQALARVGIKPAESYWIAHPGMGGSALNLTVSGYLKLFDQMESFCSGPLVLTLGDSRSDLEMVEAIVDERPHIRILPKVSLEGLGWVYSTASLVVAPSTGPLHLAHYVGAKTLGIFSPVRSHQPRRWAPWGGTGYSMFFAPQHACPGKKHCIGPRCRYYYCLDQMVEAGLPSSVGNALRVSAGA